MATVAGANVTEGATEDAAGGSCPVCGERLLGAFCHRCGEERPHPERLSLGHFFRQAAAELMDFEHSKVVATLRSLFLRPGLLTNEWIAGRKSPYVSPLKLLLVAFALYLFLFTFYRPVAVYDLQAMVENDWTGQWRKMIGEISAELRLPPEEFIARVNEKWQTYVSLLQLAAVVMTALLLKLFYLLTERRLVEHFVFSLHLFSFTYLLPVVTWPIYLLTGVGLTRASMVFSAVSVVVGLAYSFLALRRVYRQAFGWTLLKTGLLYVGTYLITLSVMIFTLLLAVAHVAVAALR